MHPLVKLSIAVILVVQVDAKVYNRCEFASYLSRYGIPRDQIPTWSCIASHESNYNTQAINGQSGDYGILQISHLFWCSDGNQPGNQCGITCNSLLQDDIAGSLRCAQIVFQQTQQLGRNGFSAWTTYGSCQGDNSQYVAGCSF